MEQTRPATPVRRGWVPRQRTAPGVIPPAVVPPGRRLRLVVVLVAGALALLCMGGAGVAFVLYANVTTPDRSTPETAALSFLDAYLLQRDDVVADLHLCEQPSIAPLTAYRSDTVEWEQRQGTLSAMTIGQLTTESSGQDRAVLTVEVERRMPNGGLITRLTDRWRITTVDEGGWRVCQVERLT
ncbi:hypothetical protein O7623_23300 [Solwaraspora sp. WMMD791]|uniref:hypothetical protein n=1 Tax=Solwaraspora sp. WMMD791 TaxID=3016086 RepID=UPI00249A7BE1|nr:hypothetical protein [Solwaraspora sp. WMMD791]WFE26246.1 hypothetical protein O7623_23300 [Solwaraspora sp. WMMD791]